MRKLSARAFARRTPVFVLAALVGALASCKTPPPTPFAHSIHPEVFDNGPPVPRGEGVSVANAVMASPVEIDPAAARGYENLPEDLRDLYDTEPREIALRDVVEQTLQNDRSIRIRNYVLQMDEARIPIEKGIYDAVFRARLNQIKDSTQAASGIQAAGTRRTRQSGASISQLLPSGGTVALEHVFGRINQNFAFAAINPIISHAFALSLRQPLLQGFGPNVTNVDIHIAQEDYRISSAEFRRQVMDRVRQALDMYWDLVFAVERYDVRLISYTAALDLLRVNAAKERAGVMAPTDVLQAQARAEQRREDVILARQAVRDAEDSLKQAMFFQPEAPAWDLELRPSGELSWHEGDANIQIALGEAWEKRPEIEAAAALLDRRDLEIVKAKDLLKPTLDVFGSAEISGLGNTNEIAFDNLEATEYNTFEFGLEFSHALQNRAGRYLHRQAKTAREMALEDFLRVRDQVTFDVRQAVRGLRTARERIDVAAARVASEQANLEAERKRLEFGVSTSFQVLEFQDFFASAQEAYVQAVVDYNKAWIALERARGAILDTNGVEISTPAASPSRKREVMPTGAN